LTVFMQMIEQRRMDEMSGSELLDHVDVLHQSQRRAEVEILRAALQFAVINNPDTLDPARSGRKGRQRAVDLGGAGTPQVREFAAAEFGARLEMSTYSAKTLIGDALDLEGRLPVRVSYARYVAKRTRDLPKDQAGYVDGRVALYADGRVTWTRFTDLVEAAIKAADPAAAAAREAAAAKEQFAKPTRSTEHGMRGFYIRASFALIARLDATVAYVADALLALGDTSSLEDRRVKAVLILANPVQAVEILKAYAAWRARAKDESADQPDDTTPQPFDPQQPAPEPPVEWSKLLPAVWIYVHMYSHADRHGISRVEGMGAVSRDWVRQHLGDKARFKITEVFDLAGQAPVDSYEIPDRHRQAVHLMTPADIFPFSTNTSRDMQVDHKRALPTRCGRRRQRAVEGGQLRADDHGPPPDQDARGLAGPAALRRHLRLARPLRRVLPGRPHRHPAHQPRPDGERT